MTIKFHVATELGEDFEEIHCDNPESCRDILKVNGEGNVSRHYVLCCNIKAKE